MTSSSGEPFLVCRKDQGFVRFDIDPTAKYPKLLNTPLLPPLQQNLKPFLCDANLDHLKYITVINSSRSGLGVSSSLYFNVVLPLFEEFGIRHVCVQTSTKDCVRNNAQSFGTSGTVLLFGGDTTIHEFINGLPRVDGPLDLRIIVVPTGTGNAFANSAGFETPLQAIRSLFLSDKLHSRRWQPLSCFPITMPRHEPVCAVVVFSFGLHAGLVGDSDTEEMRKLGPQRFGIAAQQLVARDPIYLAKVPGVPGTTEHSYLLVTTMKMLEKKFLISPESDPPSSNKLFLVHISKVTAERFMAIMGDVYKEGAHLQQPEVTYTPITDDMAFEILPQPELERRCCIDGAIFVSEPGVVTIGAASHRWNGWNLFIWS